jgi:hypothetical protein
MTTDKATTPPLTGAELGIVRDGWMTQEFVNEAFEYVDGDLFWKVRPSSHFSSVAVARSRNTSLAGKKAGTNQGDYISVNFPRPRSLVKLHRIIFLMHHGYLPAEIDHIDGNPFNNRIENLRPVTRSQNMRNTRTRRKTATGVKGVGMKGKRFHAFIKKDKKQIHLGMFATLEEAIAARKLAEKEHYGEYANDR